MAHFVIKEGDTSPAITATLLDAADAAVNLAGASVKFIMTLKGQTTAKVDAAATIVSAANGQVSYSWVAADTDTAGVYEAEWQVTFSGGAKQTFPNSSYLELIVLRDLG